MLCSLELLNRVQRSRPLRELLLAFFKQNETFPVAIGGEVEQVGAELGHVELHFDRVPVCEDFELAEHLIGLFARVHLHDHVENVILHRTRLMMAAGPVAEGSRSLRFDEVLELGPPLLPILSIDQLLDDRVEASLDRELPLALVASVRAVARERELATAVIFLLTVEQRFETIVVIVHSRDYHWLARARAVHLADHAVVQIVSGDLVA